MVYDIDGHFEQADLKNFEVLVFKNVYLFPFPIPRCSFQSKIDLTGT